MNTAVLRKTARDAWWLLVFVPLAIVAFEVLLVRAFGELPPEAAALLERSFVKRFVTMLLGADLTAQFTATGLVTIGLAHPFVYAVTWALLLTVCTRTTVGEIDRGTADLLLTLPLSRAAVYASAALIWVPAAAAASGATLAGLALGQWLHPLWEPVDLRALRVVAVNLFALHVSVGCVTTCVASAASRRGTTTAIVLSGLLASFLLNFLATLWPAMGRVAALGPLHYYRPLVAVRTGQWPVADLAVLGAVAAVSWLAGLWCFCRRDIPAA